ncbi:MAG: acetate--CoA ligase family protein [Candidatus Hadarchaeales archaeon]
MKRKLLNQPKAASTKRLTEQESLKIIEEAGIPFARTIVCRSLEEVLQAARTIRYPVVLKLMSSDLKERGLSGVRLGISSETELRRAFNELEKIVSAAGWKLEGWVVQEYIAGGEEVRIKAFRDDELGPSIVFEPISFWMKIFGDRSFRLAPLDRDEAKEMIKETYGYYMLVGEDGSLPVDFDALIETMCKMSDLICKLGRVVEIHLHPLKVLERGVKAVDVKVVLEVK